MFLAILEKENIDDQDYFLNLFQKNSINRLIEYIYDKFKCTNKEKKHENRNEEMKIFKIKLNERKKVE